MERITFSKPDDSAGEYPEDYLVDQIEVAQLNDYLVAFYWKRDPDSVLFNARVGGAAYVIFKDDQAIVYDTLLVPQQSKWMKQHLQSKYHLKHFTLVLSHGHADHVVGNYLYEGGPIIGHRLCRDRMIDRRKKYETGTLYPGLPPFRVVLPNEIIESRVDLYIGEILKVELHHFRIHSNDHLLVYIPEDQILLAGDALEDPVLLIFPTEIPCEVNRPEMERLLAMDIVTIFPNHGHWPTINSGGYDKRFITNMLQYNNEMRRRVYETDYLSGPVESYIGDALAAGELHWWAPYHEAHQDNLNRVYAYYNPSP